MKSAEEKTDTFGNLGKKVEQAEDEDEGWRQYTAPDGTQPQYVEINKHGQIRTNRPTWSLLGFKTEAEWFRSALWASIHPARCPTKK